MPVDRANKRFSCNFPTCSKTFGRPYDLERHNHVHCDYEERQFGCPFVGCGFRANQQGGLKCHMNSIHENIRLSCGEPGCVKTFSDPSSRSKHIKKFHRTEEDSGSSERGWDRKKKNSVAYPASVHARVARHVEDAKGILNQFATFAVHDPSNPAPANYGTRRSASVPSTSVIQPSPRRHPGVFHRANDVPIDRSSIDEKSQPLHQAYNVNSWAAPTARGYYPNASVLTRPQAPTMNQLQDPGLIQGDVDASRAAHDQSCHCWHCAVGDVTRAPVRGQQEEDRARREGQARIPFSYAGTGHVSPSDQHWSSVYPRPNPRFLFDIR